MKYLHLLILAVAVHASGNASNSTNEIIEANRSRNDIPLPGYDPANDPDILPDNNTLGVQTIRFEGEVNGCNGYVRYCNKKLSQVLWMGAHNSLSDVGFALQRNQFVNGPQLLDAGIRYFDVDTCAYVKNGNRNSPTVCHGFVWWRTQVYQPTRNGLQLIKTWLDAHPREVIFINFGDIGDFTVLNSGGEATSTPQIREELVSTLRSVFGSIVVLRNDPLDSELNTGKATMNDLIKSNRRVIINIDKRNSDNPAYWGQNDRVCNYVWYPDSLKADILHNNYYWQPVLDHAETQMRIPCSNSPKLLNKLEFQFHTALGGTIDSSRVGETLSAYLASLKQRNDVSKTAPYYPFNLILTDHSDKWSSYYPQWHANHLSFLKE